MMFALSVLVVLLSATAAHSQALTCWFTERGFPPVRIVLDPRAGTALMGTNPAPWRLDVSETHYRMSNGQGGGVVIRRQNGLGALVAPQAGPLYMRCEPERRL